MRIIELLEFQSATRKLFSSAELDELREYLASSPESGSVIPGTGGLRKLRWRSKGKGKRGGARVIYFYFVSRNSVYLLTAYGKGQKEDLSPSEKKLWREVIEILNSGASE